MECNASDQGAQEVDEPLIGIQYPMLCSCKNGRWQIGTGSIRQNEQKPTGLRFVQWTHHDPREATRADPPPESTRAVYLPIESWPPVQAEEPDNILVLTTRKESANSLRSFCHQSRRNTNVETAVKVAGATAKHCIVLHGQSSFLSGHSNRSDFDKECYTRANVALSRATDLTVLACPLNMHGLEGAAQVIAALLHGACTLHTSDTVPGTAQIAGTFEIGDLAVQAETAAFLKATEPHPLWEGPAPLCLAEHYEGKVRRLRLVLTKQGCLSQGEQNQFLNHTHPLHGSGLLFGYAADGLANPDWLIVSDTSHPGAWRAGGSRFTVGSTVRFPPGKCDVANKARLYQFEALHEICFYDAWRSEPILDREDSSLLLPPAPGMLQEGCYWRPAAAASADTQPPATGEPAGSLASDDLDLLSSGGQPSLLPSPDSTHSVQNFHDQPVSGSSQEEESSPTQASEPAAPSVGTVTSPVGEDETPVHEISSCDSPKPVNEGAEDREEEAATDDSVVEQQEEHEIASVWEVNDSSSVSSQGHYEPVDGVRSQSAKSPPSVASPCSLSGQ